jgi:hypothetical protein
MLRSTILAATLITGTFLSNQPLSAAHFVDQIAYPGKPYDEKLLEGQPAGIVDVINGPLRTVGACSYWSDHPDHTKVFAFEIRNMDDLNRLIGLFSQIDGQKRIVHLTSMPPFSPLRNANVDPPSSRPAATLTISNQADLNEWYRHASEERIRRILGPSAIHHPPVAGPPTLMVFVPHPLVDLDQLIIPENISLTVDRSPNAATPTAYFTSNDSLTCYKHIFWSPNCLKYRPDSIRASEQIKEFLSR